MSDRGRLRAGQIRAELVRQYDRMRRLRFATLGVIVVTMLVAVPVALNADKLVRDPAFMVLDELDLPEWAAGSPHDTAYGNRWCLGQCRVRERTWQSTGTVARTRATYESALSARGWRESTRPCRTNSEAAQWLCVQRDEYVMDVEFQAVGCDEEGRNCSATSVTATVRPVTTVAPDAGASGRLE